MIKTKNLLSGPEEPNLHEKQEKQRNTNIIQPWCVDMYILLWLYVAITVRDRFPFILGPPYVGLYFNPKNQGDAEREVEQPFRTNGKDDEARCERLE